MKIESEILIESFLKTSKLLTRETAIQLFQFIAEKPSTKIYIDFKQISFISRSFADQFHKEKINLLEKTGKQVLLKNHNNDVFEMFNVVAKTQSQHKIIKSSNIIFYEFEQRSRVKDFLFSF